MLNRLDALPMVARLSWKLLCLVETLLKGQLEILRIDLGCVSTGLLLSCNISPHGYLLLELAWH
jgi:hypothetical protein